MGQALSRKQLLVWGLPCLGVYCVSEEPHPRGVLSLRFGRFLSLFLVLVKCWDTTKCHLFLFLV